MKISPELFSLCETLAHIAKFPARNSPPLENTDWSRWITLAEKHRLAPLLGSRADEITGVPQEVRESLRIACHREGRLALLRAAELANVLRLVAPVAGCIVLKGAAVTPMLYRNFSERPMGDIDLLLSGDADLRLVDAALKNGGFLSRTYEDRKIKLDGHHHAAPLQEPYGLLAVELHTNFVTPPLPDGLMRELWDRRVVFRGQGPEMHVLDPAGMLIHHAIHALNDPLSSPLLRNLFETALLASRLTDGDATALRERCERWKIAAPVARALWLAHDLFGTPAVFGRPPRTYYEFWFPLCLEQTAARTTREKIIREIARRHLEMLGVGRDPRSAFQLAGAAAETIWCPLSTRLRRHDGPLHRITGCHVGLDGALLLYAQPTSEVHLLNPAAARVFLAADGKKTAAEIERAVAANGGPARRDTRTALRALFASGLLRG